MHEHTDRKPATVVYLDVALTPDMALCDVLDAVPSRWVERVQCQPGVSPDRVKVVLSEDATPHAVAELRAALAPLVLADPVLKRGNVGTAFVPARA